MGLYSVATDLSPPVSDVSEERAVPAQSQTADRSAQSIPNLWQPRRSTAGEYHKSEAGVTFEIICESRIGFPFGVDEDCEWCLGPDPVFGRVGGQNCRTGNRWHP